MDIQQLLSHIKLAGITYSEDDGKNILIATETQLLDLGRRISDQAKLELMSDAQSEPDFLRITDDRNEVTLIDPCLINAASTYFAKGEPLSNYEPTKRDRYCINVTLHEPASYKVSTDRLPRTLSFTFNTRDGQQRAFEEIERAQKKAQAYRRSQVIAAKHPSSKIEFINLLEQITRNLKVNSDATATTGEAGSASV